MRKIIKKVTATAMAMTMAFAIVGCGEKKSEDKTTEASPSDSDTTAGAAGNEDDSAKGNFDISIEEMSRLMGNGINLGNTMEAIGRSMDAVAPSVKSCECAWGSPETTKEMIVAMKASGFDTLRIPTGWANMMDYTHGDYTIDPAYLDRVQEITDWAIEAGMYVAINDHWDNQWWGMFGDADQKVRDSAWTMYETMWTQIAERFKDYDEHLLFEAANEELGDRLNDDWHLGNTQTGTLNEDEKYDYTNRINQLFVDTVRATGGNNAKRFLIASGFNTDIAKTCDDRFIMPTDTVEGKLFLSVHYYDPGDFCLHTVNTWGTKDEYDAMNNTLKKLCKLTQAGYGVFIGEYGALPTDDTGFKEDTYIYTLNMLDNCDEYNLVPVLWDTNWMFDRANGKLAVEEVSDLFGARSAASEKDKTQDDVAAAAKESKNESYSKAEDGFALGSDKAIAWIMYSAGDWNTNYSVGDVYDPSNATTGVVATDVEISGEGTYTVALDFTGTAGGFVNGAQFIAVGLANGETLFPGYSIDIKEVKVNDTAIALVGKPYTCSDDKTCTRVNLYNQWVTDKDVEAALGDEECNFRTPDSDTSGITAMPINPADIANATTISVTFDYVAPVQ